MLLLLVYFTTYYYKIHYKGQFINYVDRILRIILVYKLTYVVPEKFDQINCWATMIFFFFLNFESLFWGHKISGLFFTFQNLIATPTISQDLFYAIIVEFLLKINITAKMLKFCLLNTYVVQQEIIFECSVCVIHATCFWI